jgi:hypothetical protein
MVISRLAKSRACWAAAAIWLGAPAVPIPYCILNPPAIYAQDISDEIKNPCQPIMDAIHRVDSSLGRYREAAQRYFDRGDDEFFEMALKEMLKLFDRKKALVSEEKLCCDKNNQLRKPFDAILDWIEKEKVESLYRLAFVNDMQWVSDKNLSDAEEALKYYHQVLEFGDTCYKEYSEAAIERLGSELGPTSQAFE